MQPRIFFFCSFFLSLALFAKSAPLRFFADSVSIEGRWDITLDMNGKQAPSWLEVRHSGFHTLVGNWVGVSGSARPIAKITYNGSKLSFSIPPQWESGNNDLVVEAQVQGESLTGTAIFPDGQKYSWTGVRAPSLKRATTPIWGKPIHLFNGRDLTGWHATGQNQWVAEQGILRSPKSGANLVTDEKYNDFKLHVEFRYPKGSNSGVYLRGRHEVQVVDGIDGEEPPVSDFGAVYGFIAPSARANKPAGTWQSYDITLVGRMVTIVANGQTIICNQEIPGITGGALDSKEGEPGPIYFQGDHGPIEYRNIVLTPAK